MQTVILPVFNVGKYRFFKFAGRVFTLLVLLCVASFAVAQEGVEPNSKQLKFWNDYEPESIMQVNHDSWQEILNLYVSDNHPSGINRFDYASVSSADRQKIKNYLDYLQLLEPRQLNYEEAKAYWINLYNAILVDDVLDAFESEPISTVRDLRSGAFRPWPWSREAVEVLLQKLSLSGIENNIIRPVLKDRRIHFVLAKASLGGGSLLKTAFNGENNEELLNKAEKGYLNHPRGVLVAADGTVRLSSIFEWFAKDFASDQSQLLSYISEHVSEENKAQLLRATNISYAYDWALNNN